MAFLVPNLMGFSLPAQFFSIYPIQIHPLSIPSQTNSVLSDLPKHPQNQDRKSGICVVCQQQSLVQRMCQHIHADTLSLFATIIAPTAPTRRVNSNLQWRLPLIEESVAAAVLEVVALLAEE